MIPWSAPGCGHRRHGGGNVPPGWDLQLTEYGDGHWRATFYVTGQAHSIVDGSAWEAATWTAVQRPASAALLKALRMHAQVRRREGLN
jgi:hypothetical protein